MSNPGNSAASRDIAYHLHGYTDLKAHEEKGPVIISEGSGVRISDDSGRSYIDGLAGLWCTSLGHGEERLVQAAANAMRKLGYFHTFASKTPEATVELATKLIEMAPVPMSKVIFANSGSEVIDLAVKIIWYYHNAIGKPEKKKLISRIKGYHGITVAGASLTGLPHLHGDFDLPIDRVLHTDCPHHYRFAEEGESEEDFATRCAENLEKMILDEGPETVAAMFCEPVMGAGGVLIPPPTYYEKIQAVLKKYDVLLLADEVINGFGRTGNMWGSTTMGMEPDMLTCAKQLSSAYIPISGLMVNEKIYQALLKNSEKLGIFGHGGTYAGHPVAAAVALETLNIYEERDIVACVRAVMPTFQGHIKRLGEHHLVGEARTVGLVGALELVKDKATGEAFDAARKVGGYMQARCEEHGLIIRAIGDNVAFCPPLIISEAEIDEMFEIAGRALEETAQWVESEGLRAA